MKKKTFACFVILSFLFGAACLANAVVIDFAGGTATLSGGGTVITDDTSPYSSSVLSYEENGFQTISVRLGPSYG